MNRISNTKQICTLRAFCYEAEFRLGSATSADYANVEIRIRVGKSSLAESPPSFVSFHDLRRLVRYLEAHLERLRTHSDAESYVFVPLELGFQVHALTGEVQSPEDGAFSLRLMVNLREPTADAENVYVGCEGSIDVRDVRAFIADVEAAIEALGLSVGSSTT